MGISISLDELVQHVQQADHGFDRIGRRVDADHRVAAAVQQAVQNRRADADQVVGRMIRLQPNRQPAGQADRVAEPRDDAALAGHQDEVLVAHQLADGGDHFRRQAGRKRAQQFGRRLVAQQPVAKLADGHVGHRLERGRIVRVDDQPRHFVGLVRNDRFIEKLPQRHVGERHLRGHALFVVLGGDAGQRIAAPRGRGLRQQLFQAVEAVRLFSNGRAKVGHGDCTVRRICIGYAVGGFFHHSGSRITADTINPASEIWKNTRPIGFAGHDAWQVSAEHRAQSNRRR